MEEVSPPTALLEVAALPAVSTGAGLYAGPPLRWWMLACADRRGDRQASRRRDHQLLLDEDHVGIVDVVGLDEDVDADLELPSDAEQRVALLHGVDQRTGAAGWLRRWRHGNGGFGGRGNGQLGDFHCDHRRLDWTRWGGRLGRGAVGVGVVDDSADVVSMVGPFSSSPPKQPVRPSVSPTAKATRTKPLQNLLRLMGRSLHKANRCGTDAATPRHVSPGTAAPESTFGQMDGDSAPDPGVSGTAAIVSKAPRHAARTPVPCAYMLCPSRRRRWCFSTPGWRRPGWWMWTDGIPTAFPCARRTPNVSGRRWAGWFPTSAAHRTSRHPPRPSR